MTPERMSGFPGRLAYLINRAINPPPTDVDPHHIRLSHGSHSQHQNCARCGATIALTGIETCDRVRRRSRLLSAVDAMVLTTECRFERVDAARDCVRERGLGIGDGGCCPRLPLAIELASAG